MYNKMNKQNIVLTSIKMHDRKKSKTEKSPTHSIKLYKSTLSKQPYFVKNKHSIVRNHSHSRTKDTKDTKTNNSTLNRHPGDPIHTIESRKSHRFAQGSLSNSNCHRHQSDFNKITQSPLIQPRSRQTQPRIEDLLGIGSSDFSKKTSIVVPINQITHQSSICNESFDSEMEKLRAQNKQLMKVNQMLLYEKEYYKQKNILQEVQIRELNRKVNELADSISSKKYHQKNKSQSQESDLTFKFRSEKEKQNKKQVINELKQTRNHRIINLVDQNYTQKSSLLVSESEQERVALRNRQNIDFGGEVESTSQVRKTEKQFADLLQCVQNQSNLHRKTTLRKMLALKAMELKKVKQKY